MKQTILFGGYTRRSGKGIYQMILDTEEKSLSALQLLVEEASPTYLAVDAQHHLYSVGAVEDSGGIAAFSFEGNHGTFLNHVVEEGTAPLCYVAVDEERNLVYGANYHQGIVYVYHRETNGSLTLASSLQHVGCGPHENQLTPHVHYTDLTPDKRLVVCDLGTDSVTTYEVSESGELTEVSNYQATSGAGARHLVFHPNQFNAYLFCELNSTIEVLKYEKKSGSFSRLQVVSTLPGNYTDFNGGAAIRLSKDGKFLYASNRGHNSIVMFTVSENGQEISAPRWTDTKGDFPRDFHLSKEEDFLIVANQNSDNVTLFERDLETGELSLVQQDIFLPEGTAVYPL